MAAAALLVVGGQQVGATAWGDFENVATRMCMDVGSYAARTPVIQYPCQRVVHGSQSWTMVQWGNDGVFIQNLGNPNMCMDIGRTEVGSPVLISWCHLREDYPSQKFRITYADVNELQIRSTITGLCLDVGSLQGTAVHLRGCERGNPSQFWQT